MNTALFPRVTRVGCLKKLGDLPNRSMTWGENMDTPHVSCHSLTNKIKYFTFTDLLNLFIGHINQICVLDIIVRL